MDNVSREQRIIRTSIIGIIANVLLAGFKAAVGLISHSVAITLDAVNNLSDALASLITIIGTRLAQKAPDKKHPLGYGRIEYLSATVISVIVLYAGVTSFIESVKKIMHPEASDYSAVALLIISVAVAVKILLGTYVRRVGREVSSDSLVASGSDALFDSVISASTLAAAVLYLTVGIRVEAWLGAAISVIIIRSGIDLLRGTTSEILGERINHELARNVKKTINSFPEVEGAYDLIIHSYGPEKLIGSVHIAVPESMTVGELDHLERAIVLKVMEETQVVMAGISVYSISRSPRAREVESAIRDYVMTQPGVLQMHGFYLDEQEKCIRFDLIIDYAAPNRRETFLAVQKKIEEMYPHDKVQIILDGDVSD